MNRGILATSLLLLVACRGGAEKEGVAMSKSAENRAPDAIAIVTTDGSMMLAVRADSIRMRLSDSVLAEASKGLDSSTAKGDGFSASIEKFVKKTVKSGLGMELTVAISTLKDARVEHGAIVLENKSGSTKSVFSSTKVDKKPLLESFSAADAERFVKAVKERIVSP